MHDDERLVERANWNVLNKDKLAAYVTDKYIKPLLEKGLLQMTIPDKPKSRLQKYYTAKNKM